MMKKYMLRYFLPLMLILGACQNTDIDNVFDKSPEERTNQEVEDLRKTLIDSEHGWIAKYYFGDSIINTPLRFRFKENNRVVTQSVFENYENKESNYTLKYSEQIDLTFDTYNVLSYLVDLTRAADFRWQLESRTADEIKFVSRADIFEGQSYLTLERANQNADAFMADQMEIHQTRMQLVHNPRKSFFRNLRTSASPFGFRVNFNEYTDIIRFFGVFDGSLKYFYSKVNFSTDGKVNLETPLKIGGKEVRQFTLNKQNDTFEISDSNGVTGQILYDTRPFMNRQGLADLFQSIGFSYIGGFGTNAGDLFDKMYADMPFILGVQFYNYDGFRGIFFVRQLESGEYSWDGINNMTFRTLADNLVWLDADSKTNTFESDWFEEYYNSSANLKAFYKDFLCHHDGLFVEYMDDTQEIYLVSKKDPSMYIEIIPVQ